MFSRILVALDGSQTASKALDAAIELARDSAAELQPLYVIDMPMLAYDVPGFDPSIIRDAYVEESRILGADAQNRMTGAGVRGARARRKSSWAPMTSRNASNARPPTGTPI